MTEAREIGGVLDILATHLPALWVASVELMGRSVKRQSEATAAVGA